MQTITISGNWMEDGYLADLAPRRLEVAILNGRAYAVDDCGHAECRLSIDRDGSVRGWGAGISFAPGEGEIERVGREAFAPYKG